MYGVLIKLIVGASLFQLGVSLKDFEKCDSRECLARLEKASRKATKIDWRPISMFPEEAKKFRH